MGRIYNSAYCTMLRDREKAKNPEIKRSSKEISAIDNQAMIADMIMLEAKDIKCIRGTGKESLVGDADLIIKVYEKYPDTYKFLSDMYNMIINPENEEAKKVASKDNYLEMPIDHALRVLENIR